MEDFLYTPSISFESNPEFVAMMETDNKIREMSVPDESAVLRQETDNKIRE